MKNLTLLLIAIITFSCSEEKAKDTNAFAKAEKTTTQFKPASAFFPKEKAQILVVGTFHMNYPGLDSHKTTEDDKIDVLKEPKKSEMTELVAYIKKFKPTKIAIEAGKSWNATQKLNEYKDGKYKDNRDERYQVAMRIASDLNLDTLYSVNAGALSRDIWQKDSIFAKTLVDKVDWEVKDPNEKKQYDWYEYNDEITKSAHLLDYLKYMNSPESHQYGYGAYFTGWFKDESNQGADHLSMWWYNRNLRIFRNIIGVTESPQDRIMVLMGNGHAAVLRQMIEASPEYDFVEFDSL